MTRNHRKPTTVRTKGISSERILATKRTGSIATAPTAILARRDQSTWVKASGAKTMVGNAGPPAAIPSGTKPAKVASVPTPMPSRR
jgi:hypothetical protein